MHTTVEPLYTLGTVSSVLIKGGVLISGVSWAPLYTDTHTPDVYPPCQKERKIMDLIERNLSTG